MKQGKKQKATRTFYKALEYIQTKGQSSEQVLNQAMELASPLLKLCSSKKGSKNVLSPRPLTLKQQRRVGILWMVDQASKNKNRLEFGEKLGQEMLNLVNGTSPILQRKLLLHKQALQNRSNVLMTDRIL